MVVRTVGRGGQTLTPVRNRATQPQPALRLRTRVQIPNGIFHKGKQPLQLHHRYSSNGGLRRMRNAGALADEDEEDIRLFVELPIHFDVVVHI